MKATCHCGNVSVTIAHPPHYINLCDCTLCASSGAAWGYYSSNEVSVEGATKAYRRADFDEPYVELRFCTDCSAATHWVLTENAQGDKIGVNMRLFDPSRLDGVEVRTLDGRNWTGEEPAKHRRPTGKLGQDIFI